MENVHIGVQLSTIISSVREIGIYEALRQCTDIGIYHVEVSQFQMTPENVEQLLKAKQELNIQIDALSCLLAPIESEWNALFDNLENQFEKIVQDCKTLDCTAVRIGSTPAEAVNSYEGAVEFAKKTDVMGKRLKEHDIDLYFHTHHMEFAMYNGKTVLDIFRDNAQHIGFELDTHWIQRGGFNPVTVIEHYKGRVRLLHLKDFRINGAKYGTMDVNLDDLIEYAEVGEGSIPMAECIEAGIRSGCDYFFIEQDETYERTPMESLKLSYDNLVKMGYGECFKP